MTADKPETPAAVANTAEVSSVLSGGHPQGASGTGNGTAPGPFVSIPQIGAYRTADHRYYWNGKGPLPSVTSILSVLDKPAVVQWAKRTVAEFAVRSFHDGSLQDHLRQMPNPDTETVRWLASLPDYQKDQAGKLGSGVHLLADMQARGDQTFVVSETEAPYLAAFKNFLNWLHGQGAEIVSSEKMVWSSDGYAGTYDLIVKFPYCQNHDPNSGPGSDQCMVCQRYAGEQIADLWLIDIKTSKGYYPETALQLVAYGYADQIILEGNPDGYPMPIVNRYGVLHLRPELYSDTGYRLIEYPIQDSDYVAFLGALELYRWKQEGRYTKARLKNANPL